MTTRNFYCPQHWWFSPAPSRNNARARPAADQRKSQDGFAPKPPHRCPTNRPGFARAILLKMKPECDTPSAPRRVADLGWSSSTRVGHLQCRVAFAKIRSAARRLWRLWNFWRRRLAVEPIKKPPAKASRKRATLGFSLMGNAIHLAAAFSSAKRILISTSRSRCAGSAMRSCSSSGSARRSKSCSVLKSGQ